MAKNRFKDPRTQAPAETRGLFAILQTALRVDSVFESGLPVRYVPRLLFITGLTLFYIGNNHYARKNIVRINQTQSQTEELRVDYITLKAEYMFASKQSEVARRVAPIGLVESQTPPRKIVLDED